MDFLTEEVCLEAQKDLGTLDLTEIEALCRYFSRVGHHRIDMRAQEVSKGLSGGHDIFKYRFLFGLEGQIGNLLLPKYQVFELWTGCVTRDFDSIVADRAIIFVVFLNFPPSNLETFAMIP